MVFFLSKIVFSSYSFNSLSMKPLTLDSLSISFLILFSNLVSLEKNFLEPKLLIETLIETDKALTESIEVFGNKNFSEDLLENEKENIRLVFLNESLNAISKKPLFGYGTGSFGSFFQDKVHSGHKFYTHTTPHNQYLYVWFEIGFFGLVLLLSVFYLQIRQLIKFEDKFHTILLPIIFLLLMCVDSYLTIFTGAITYMFLFTIYTRYNNLAREALSSGDKILSENYLQHADHFSSCLLYTSPSPRDQRGSGMAA